MNVNYQIRVTFFCIFFLVTIPNLALATISLDEIAWMGTNTSQYEEWIELHNDGDATNLAGWKLYKSGGTVLYSLTGTIESGDYYVVCRTTASLTNPLGGACNEQGAWGGSGLNNTSDQIVLKDAAGATITSIDATGGWPAGDAPSKQTMQRSGGTWITGEPTPGAQNATGSSEGTGDTGNDDADDTDDDTSDDTTTTSSSHNGSSKDPKERIERIKPDPVYSAHMIVPDYALAGVSVPFKAEVTRDKLFSSLRGKYEWSFGDGASAVFAKNTPTNHTFAYPGDYTVTLAYSSNRLEPDPDTIHRKTITVLPSAITIAGMTDDGGVILENDTGKDLDIAGWMIGGNGQLFTFPKNTTIAQDSKLSVSSEVMGFRVTPETANLLNPTGSYATGYHHLQAYELPDNNTPNDSGADGGDWSAQHAAASVDQSGLFERYREYGWYIAFGALVIVVLIAYLVAKLYDANSEPAESADDLEADLL